MRRGVFLGALLCLWGCTPTAPLPWQLLELGQGSLPDALEQGQWVLAQSDRGEGWWVPDTSMTGQSLVRDLRTLPEIACGDHMRLSTSDFPLSIRAELGWGEADSLTVWWRCLGKMELAEHHLTSMRRRPFDRARIERDWLTLLQRAEPDWSQPGHTSISLGEPVNLTISTQRADGRMLEPNPIMLRFHQGDEGQVVPALESWLSQARRGSQIALWCSSADAFGVEAHPDLGLPAHMPLRFSAKVE